VTTPPPPPEEPTVVVPGQRRAVVDEEYVEGPPPVVRPYPWWLWVLAAIFLALAILFAVLWYMERNDTEDVPMVEGLNIAQAKDKVAGKFSLITVSRPSGEPAGTVTMQAPGAGAALETGSNMMVVVSAGQQQVTVPKLIGSTQTAAEQLLESQGLQANVRNVDSTKPKGIVVAQDPPEATRVPKGTSVGLAVSTGQGQVKVPGVQGTSQADAVRAVTEAGLVPVVVQVPSQQPEGTVIAQDPAPNQEARAGSKVRMNVSGGPASTQTTTVTTSQTTTATTVTTSETTTP
jgi:beta-lactam-binding protein with PASTA domain